MMPNRPIPSDDRTMLFETWRSSIAAEGMIKQLVDRQDKHEKLVGDYHLRLREVEQFVRDQKQTSRWRKAVTSVIAVAVAAPFGIWLWEKFLRLGELLRGAK